VLGNETPEASVVAWAVSVPDRPTRTPWSGVPLQLTVPEMLSGFVSVAAKSRPVASAPASFTSSFGGENAKFSRVGVIV
jgi:hypothetical protein